MNASRDAVDIVLCGGHLLSNPDVGDVPPHGMTVIKDHTLVAVNVPWDPEIRADKVIDCTNCLIMPGIINCHTHGGMGLLRGLADDMPLDTWLRRFIFPVEQQWVKPDFVYLGCLVSMAEMVLNGITTCADGYYFMENAARAAIAIGMRAIVAQGILDVPTPDAHEPERCMDRAMEFIECCPRHQLIRPALFCHSPYLCSPDTLIAAADAARNHSLRLFCHVAETKDEVRAIRARYHASPAAHLRDVGVFGENFVAVHCTHVNSEDMDMIAETGAKVVHCPESNMKLGSGAAPVVQMLHRQIGVGLGTDSAASNNDLDMWGEMRTAALLAKLVASDPAALDAKTVVRMATMEGARVLGLSDMVGSLEPGKRADVAVIDMTGMHLTPMYDMISHLVYCGRGSDVRDVLIDGQVVVRNREIQTVDQQEIKDRARETSRNIKAGL
ncbi:MAG: amidohydrolase [Desulfomonilaceae bacterium]